MSLPAIVIDFETRSGAELNRVGIGNYLSDPHYELLCAVARLPDGTWVTMLGRGPDDPADARKRLLTAVAAGHPVVAHNADAFDRLVWEYEGLPNPSRWIDTLPLARRLGLPGGLDQIGEKLFGVGKDTDGQKLTLALSFYDKNGRLPPLTPQTLGSVAGYCRRDVELLARLWDEVLTRIQPSHEDRVLAANTNINVRGIQLDTKLARDIIYCCEAVATAARKQVPTECRSLISSPKRLRGWLNSQGLAVERVDYAVIEELLADEHLPEHVRAVLVARAASAPNTVRRLRSALARVESDGRLRHMLSYHGAHTGRWSGRGFQPQNLPRGIKIDVHAAISAVQAHDIDALSKLGPVEDALITLVRPCLKAGHGLTLAVADYSSIEARALLWLAGDDRGLDVFRRGADPYVDMASRLYCRSAEAINGVQRQLGKALILGCGYGLGARGFAGYAEAMGIDLAASGFTPEAAVNSWRDANPAVAGYPTGETFSGRTCRRGGLWKDMEFAAVSAVRQGGDHYAGRCWWSMCGKDLICRLPSGRGLVYADARLVERDTPWGASKQVLEHALRSGRVVTYGGRLVENVTQAVCRDLLAHALVQAEDVGLAVVLHVHDEIVCEVAAREGEKGLGRLIEVMTCGPKWADGLPVAARGYVGERYRK